MSSLDGLLEVVADECHVKQPSGERAVFAAWPASAVT